MISGWVPAGLNYSTFTGNTYPYVTPQLGAFVGAMLEIPAFIDDFYLQPEIMLCLQGAQIGIGKLNLLYLQLPIMAKYHITDEIAMKAGPQIGFVVSDNGSAYIDSATLSPLQTNVFHVSFNFGGGVSIERCHLLSIAF